MAAKKKVYWLGELVGKKRVGRIKVNGKQISIGESFTADKLDNDRLSQLRKAGCIADAPFAVVEPVNDDLVLLQGKVSELEKAAKADGDTIAGLHLDLEAAGDTVDLKKRITELGYEVERLKGEDEEAADKKAAHIEANKTKKSKNKDGKK